MKQGSYEENSINLWGAVGLGTGVMIGAAIFAVIGQVAVIAGALFPLAYIGGAIVAACSAHSYVKMGNLYPSAGGIGMFFVKIYGKGAVTAGCALLMAFSMIIAQSLVARTFGTYTLQLFDIGPESNLVPVLGVGLLLFTYIVNVMKSQFVQTFVSIISLIKIAGLVVFSMAALYATGFSLEGVLSGSVPDQPAPSFVAAIALSLLSFKGFTTITNNGGEIVEPKKNIGRAITISIALCAGLYILMTWAVSSSLTIGEIAEARDYSLAQAARPVLGTYGLWFTVAIAILATITVCIAGVFAVSRMTAMLTDMKLIPHSHFGMSGTIQRHMVVYIIVLGITLTILFDLSRIASLGAMYYLVMDIIFQWGVLRRVREKIEALTPVVTASLILNTLVLSAFLWYKIRTDLLVVILAAVTIPLIFIGEYFFLRNKDFDEEDEDHEDENHEDEDHEEVKGSNDEDPRGDTDKKKN